MEKLTIEDKKFLRNSGLGLASFTACISYHSNSPFFEMYNPQIIGQYRISDLMAVTIGAVMINYCYKVCKNEIKQYFAERKQNKTAKKNYEKFGDTLEDISFLQ